jgi:hypothetical protein
MTRITSLLTSAAFLCGAAFAASRAESTTYVDGNLIGISPNTGGTLTLSDDKALSFRTGLGDVDIPYASINKAALGATKVHSENAPLYKVWSLHKRFVGKNKVESQLLTIDFKNEKGEDRTMTLELGPSAASTALATIESHGGKTVAPEAKTEVAAAPAKTAPASVPGEWWGDSYWKTKRNSDKWSKPAPNSNEQQ